MFCLLVVLAKLLLLAKWLARKTPLRKPNRGEAIVSRKPKSKSAHDFLSLLYCFIVLLCTCVVSCPYVIYYPTVMARYSLFVLKVPLNPKQTNKPIFFTVKHDELMQIIYVVVCYHANKKNIKLVLCLQIIWNMQGGKFIQVFACQKLST